MARLFDGTSVGVEDTGVLTHAGEAAHTVIEPVGIARFELGNGADSEFVEVFQHLRADAAQVSEAPGVFQTVSHAEHSNPGVL